MELKTDNSHEMINLEGLNLSNSKKVNVSLGTTDLELYVMSGSKKKMTSEINEMTNEVEKIEENEIIR